MRALYRASQRGVTIDLIVRDTCRLRPGLEGVSTTIKVISVIGRFLEHARIYYFHNNGKAEDYLGSADAMQRNLEKRVEILAPVEDPRLQGELRHLLDTQLSDQRGAWDMQPDGSYIQRSSTGAKHSQQQMIERTERRLKEATRLRSRRYRPSSRIRRVDELPQRVVGGGDRGSRDRSCCDLNRSRRQLVVRLTMRVASLLLLIVACKSSTPEPAPGSAIAPAPTPTPKVVEVDAGSPPKPAMPSTRVDGVGGGEKSFEIALPPAVKVTVDPGGEEQLPSAKLEGDGLTFTVDRPEAWPEIGFTLAEEQGMVDRGETVSYTRTDDRGDTWTMIYQRPAGSAAAGSYTVNVAYRTANLMCAAYDVDTREHADRIAAICETLKVVDAPLAAAPAKPTSHHMDKRHRTTAP